MAAAVNYYPPTERNRLLSLRRPCSVKGARHKRYILHECICLKRPEKAALQGQKAAGAGGAGSGGDPHRNRGTPGHHELINRLTSAQLSPEHKGAPGPASST